MQDGTCFSSGHPAEIAAPRGDVYARDCPTRLLLDRIGDKWSVLILLLLGDGDARFNALKRRIAGISQKMLSQTLRSLERDGLVSRRVAASVPVSVTYAVTPLGRELLATVRSMAEWAETRMDAVAQAQRRYDARVDAG